MSRVIGLVALSLAYLMSLFYRSAIAVIAPEVSAELKLDAASLSDLSSAWFWSFALSQIPVGMALDRYGPRRTVSVLMTAAVVGTVIFATASDAASAIVGQALIGVGCAPVFMGTLVAISRWFPADRFASLSSMVLAFAMAGMLLSSLPLALTAEWLGWRQAFLAVAGLTLLSLLGVAGLARGPKTTANEERESGAETLRGVLAVLRLRQLWMILPLAFVGYGTMITTRGLWAGPYLAEVFHLPAAERGYSLAAMTVAIAAGTLIYAAIERRWRSRKRPILLGTVLAVAGLLLLAVLPGVSLGIALVGLLTIGGCGASYMLIMAQTRQFLPDPLVGRGLALMNFVSFAGAGLLQLISGRVVQAATDAMLPAAAVYGWLFGFMAAYLALAIMLYLFSVDRPADGSA